MHVPSPILALAKVWTQYMFFQNESLALNDSLDDSSLSPTIFGGPFLNLKVAESLFIDASSSESSSCLFDRLSELDI